MFFLVDILHRIANKRPEECPAERNNMGEYISKGEYEGYKVYVSYAEEGPSVEEAYALYEEAHRNILYQGLAQLSEEVQE